MLFRSLSGPAAGAIGAIHAARLSDRPNVITLDMGGTSADVALIRNHQAGTSLLWPLAYGVLMIATMFYRLRGIRI
mgnify:CR=1 FL=1